MYHVDGPIELQPRRLPDYEGPDQHGEQNKQETSTHQDGRMKAPPFLAGMVSMLLLGVLALLLFISLSLAR